MGIGQDSSPGFIIQKVYLSQLPQRQTASCKNGFTMYFYNISFTASLNIIESRRSSVPSLHIWVHLQVVANKSNSFHILEPFLHKTNFWQHFLTYETAGPFHHSGCYCHTIPNPKTWDLKCFKIQNFSKANTMPQVENSTPELLWLPHLTCCDRLQSKCKYTTHSLFSIPKEKRLLSHLQLYIWHISFPCMPRSPMQAHPQRVRKWHVCRPEAPTGGSPWYPTYDQDLCALLIVVFVYFILFCLFSALWYKDIVETVGKACRHPFR